MPATPTTVLTGKAITLSVGAAEFTQQATNAHLEPTSATDTVTLVDGTEIDFPKGIKWALVIDALQDWTDPGGLYMMLADAALTATPVAFELDLTDTAGAQTSMSGTCIAAPSVFGGPAGALQGTITLAVSTLVGPTHTPAGP